ncbi:MAG: RNA polymerase sigma factor RpoD, partial [Acetoanaerobium sp.]|nr:RNA polymerase sigma factor RpoD [Acetoanaerobium sp.]
MDNELKQEKKMAVKSLIDKGKKDGSLTYEQIGEALSEMELDKEQIENIYDTFAQMGIDILDENIKDDTVIFNKEFDKDPDIEAEDEEEDVSKLD